MTDLIHSVVQTARMSAADNLSATYEPTDHSANTRTPPDGLPSPVISRSDDLRQPNAA